MASDPNGATAIIAGGVQVADERTGAVRARGEKIAADGRSENIYQVTTSAGEVKYVVWGKGTFTVPNGVTIHTSVIPPQSGNYVWEAISAGEKVTLSPNPILLK